VLDPNGLFGGHDLDSWWSYGIGRG
jgi:hypothetical protein